MTISNPAKKILSYQEALKIAKNGMLFTRLEDLDKSFEDAVNNQLLWVQFVAGGSFTAAFDDYNDAQLYDKRSECLVVGLAARLLFTDAKHGSKTDLKDLNDAVTRGEMPKGAEMGNADNLFTAMYIQYGVTGEMVKFKQQIEQYFKLLQIKLYLNNLTKTTEDQDKLKKEVKEMLNGTNLKTLETNVNNIVQQEAQYHGNEQPQIEYLPELGIGAEDLDSISDATKIAVKKLEDAGKAYYSDKSKTTINNYVEAVYEIVNVVGALKEFAETISIDKVMGQDSEQYKKINEKIHKLREDTERIKRMMLLMQRGAESHHEEAGYVEKIRNRRDEAIINGMSTFKAEVLTVLSVMFSWVIGGLKNIDVTNTVSKFMDDAKNPHLKWVKESIKRLSEKGKPSDVTYDQKVESFKVRK